MNADELLTTAEVCKVLRVSRPLLRRIVASGGLRPVPLPGCRKRLYRSADVRQLVGRTPAAE